MRPWDELSMAEKAEMMKVAVRQGITNLSDIKQRYNEFAEGGDTDWSYNSWKRQIAEYMGIRPDEDKTYDYEAYFRKYPGEAWRMLKGDPDAHFSDEFKTVYHPTFSSKSVGNDGSIYSGVKNSKTNPQGLVGGTWSPDYHTFTMSPDGYRGPVSMDDRKWYLENAENNGVVLREANGSLPIYDGIPWGGVLPNVTIYGSKHSLGGPLVEAAMNEYKKGGSIHIAPSRRGTFTAAAKKHGKSVQAFASQVLAHPENYSPAMRKKANFARNASKWKHGDGGELDTYDEPQTFAGRMAEEAGASPSIVRGTDVISSVAQMTPWGHYIAATDLGRDLNRVYHKEKGAKKDAALDLLSMIPGISAPGLKAAENTWNTIRGNNRLRKALNIGIITGRVADFVDDTWGANKTSKALGGNLFDGTTEDSQQMKIGKPYYSYDENGRKIDDTLNYNISFPEIVITPDSRKSPAERAILERERRRNNDAFYGTGTYNAKADREQTELEKIASQKAWETSTEKQALDYAQAAATGIGIGADMVSGLPVYSSLKGTSVLNRAETPLDYVEGGLWLAPVTGVVGKETLNSVKPMIKKATDTTISLHNLLGNNKFYIANTGEEESFIPNFISRNNKKPIDEQTILQEINEAKKYKESEGYRNLVESFLKDTGEDIPADVFYNSRHSQTPSIVMEERPTGHLGSYIYSENKLTVDPKQISEDVPFHEGLHWQRVGKPEVEKGEDFKAWAKAFDEDAPKEIQDMLFDKYFYSEEGQKAIRKQDAIKETYKNKINKVLYDDVPKTSEMKKPNELIAHTLGAGKVLGLKPFQEYPGFKKAIDIIDKARKKDSYLFDIKAGTEEEVKDFWKLLTGNYIPATAVGISTLSTSTLKK